MEQIIAFFESLWEKITANWQLAAVIAAAVLLVLILIIAIACRARRKKKARQRQLAALSSVPDAPEQKGGTPVASASAPEKEQPTVSGPVRTEPVHTEEAVPAAKPEPVRQTEPESRMSGSVRAAEQSQSEVRQEPEAQAQPAEPEQTASEQEAASRTASSGAEKERETGKAAGAGKPASGTRSPAARKRPSGGQSAPVSSTPKRAEEPEEIEVVNEDEKRRGQAEQFPLPRQFRPGDLDLDRQKSDNQRVTRRVKTKKEALEIAKELCKHQDMNLTVHKKDGKFQKKR